MEKICEFIDMFHNFFSNLEDIYNFCGYRPIPILIGNLALRISTYKIYKMQGIISFASLKNLTT